MTAIVGEAYGWDTVGAGFAVMATWVLVGGELFALPVAALAPPLFVSALAIATGAAALYLGVLAAHRIAVRA